MNTDEIKLVTFKIYSTVTLYLHFILQLICKLAYARQPIS
jgi:hypothetical protein